MTLSWIDWAIMGVSVLALRLISLSTRHHMKGVADFLSANRSARRYLLTIASQMGNTGVVSLVAGFEVLWLAGVAPNWWGYMGIPVSVVILLTGWVFYRFRETRALTLAQFFEMRYSKNFRVFAGVVCWSCGVLNFGIFPAVAARFFVYYCGLPDHFLIPGIPMEINTFAIVMAVDLILALSFVTMGGQISVMITECVQGMFCTLAFLVVAGAVLVSFSWPQMVEALNIANKPGQSMIHPFHTSNVEDFNFWFYLIGVFASFYTYMSWQGASGFNSSAKSPHEQKMGGIIGVWRGMPQGLAIMVLGLAALVVLRLPEYSAKAAEINLALKSLPTETLQGQMRVPIAMAHVLPVGIKGLFATIMLFISFTCHDTYMHSWGTIFIQDVYMPIRKKVLTPEEHIKLLRWSILGVALFAYFFSLYYPMTTPIFMFFAITGTIWLGGSGAVIIGGLYWKRGTTAGAYTALIIGAVLGLFGLFADKLWMILFHMKKFPINGQYLWFIAMVAAGLAYFIVSLMTGDKQKLFNLDKMLCRGDYARQCDPLPVGEQTSKWMQIAGITREFTRTDKLLALALVAWNVVFFVWFIIFTIINLFYPISNAAWGTYWHSLILIYLALSLPTTVWFTIGGVIDIKDLFKHLSTTERDHTDDGRVIHEADDEILAAPERVAESETPPEELERI